ncbi:Hypothetical predicted protein [Mytilus galloprovincialis]|uniref:VWFD domain-containing protein n=1 Tax=Mytilus galloprovincialis TaxID=29158 RepID=A0A8B6CIC2_MYTGA|nr:Hypothetical predicted protein [Mytilus galloprovincialis]
MPRRKLTSAQKWQVIGMRTTGLSLRRIAVHFGVSYSVISRLLKRHKESGTVDERERSDRPRKTSASPENWEIHGRVNVVGVKRPTGRCYSYTDPNIRTVDGRSFVSLATGEFVLYKLKKTPVEVHTIQDKVGQNCAVAVRAASDIFIVYGCGSPKKWIVRRLNCNEQTQHLKVFERSLGTAFEIILPSGTRVNIGIRGNSWLNIDIIPSFTDWNQTEGKCGTYNGDSSDDFTDRNGDIVGVADFIRSWGVTQMESLFVAKIRNEILSIPFFYCSCLPDEFPDGPITEKADCSWEDSLPTCPPLNWGQKKCQLLGKREAIDDVEIDVPENMITFEESTMSTDWKNGWNATVARQKCESTLHRSPIFKDCSSLQNVQNDQTIESCITDIQVSGSDIFLSDVIERMKSECLSELRFNASLWNNNTESSEPSLIDTVFDNACPNDCSFTGTCTKGQCFCEPSYTGDDCSIKTDRPPILYDASEESLCDLSKRPCTSTSVFGEGFFSSASIKCKLTQATLIGSTIIEGNVTKIETGNLESFAEVKCPIAGIINRRKRSATKVSDHDVILVSVSMDGTKFSSSVPVVMFNSSCSSCVISGNTVACDIRSDICIRNGECFEITNENCASSNIAPVEHVYPTISLIIGIVVGSICLLAIVVLVVVKMYNHKRRFVKDIDEPNFTMGLAKESGSAPVSHKFK